MRRNGMVSPEVLRLTPSRLVHWLSLCVVGGCSLLAASAANAVPQVPQAPTLIFFEDFQNIVPPANGMLLTGYTGGGGETYSADAAWLAGCNGLMSSGNEAAAGSFGQTAACSGQTEWNQTQQIAWALGQFKNPTTAWGNYAVSAYTSNSPAANLIEFQSNNPIALPHPGRFIAARIDVGALNCARASAPYLQFQLLDGATVLNAGAVINGCTGANGPNSYTLIDTPAIGTAPAGVGDIGETAGARVDTYTSGGVIITGSSAGIRMRNINGGGGGNDHAFDNVELLDVSPALDKSFSPTSVMVNATSTLTFTVTNTSELGSKPGWSFTDTLPAGLVVATPPATSTTCDSGSVTAVAGGSTVAVTGNLNTGSTYCTMTVNVTSASAGSYVNGPDNIVSQGLTPPQPSTVRFGAPAPVVTAVPVGTPLMLLLLSTFLAGFAGLRLRGRK